MTSKVGLSSIPGTTAYEFEWLKRWPQFEERPATLKEFLGPKYLNTEDLVRPRILKELEHIFGDEVSGDRIVRFPRAMVTGGIGIGKTTIASIVLPYLAHWVLCLKDPQKYFNMLAGSRIAFMQMSTSGAQARQVVFGDIKARIEYSPWFRAKYPYNSKMTTQLRFPKDVWIIPGDSKETTFEGYNILGGILDEADSHQVTINKDYAEEGYNTIHSRISSRFEDRGFLLVIGQMKQSGGFAAKKFREFTYDENAYAVRLSIWESRGDEYYAKRSEDGICHKFLYDVNRRQIVPPAARLARSASLLEIPEVYRPDFTNNPDKALRDLAGIPPAVNDPFITLTDRIVSARDRWERRYAGLHNPFGPNFKLADWFVAPDKLPRAIHVDIGFSGNGDAMGIAMGHVREVVKIDGEWKPYIVFDMLARFTCAPGSALFLGDMRHFIYDLRDKRKYRIGKITLDGFASQDTIQQFQSRRLNADYESMDKQMLPYEDLREALYEERIEFPPLMVRYRHMDPADDLVEIAVKELQELRYAGKKIDHPEEGSKDVADAMAGVVYTLMGDRGYAKNVQRSRSPFFGDLAKRHREDSMMKHHALVDSDLRAPVAPSAPDPWSRM